MFAKWHGRFCLFNMIVSFLLSSCGAQPATPIPNTLAPTSSSDNPLPSGWVGKVSNIVWVAYSPPNADPNKGIESSADDIRADLASLREAGFTGLVTYAATGIMGRDFPTLAQEAGFEGLILGVWDPNNQEELSNAKAASNIPIVLGYCVGNEGFEKPNRYGLSELTSAIETLRNETGKPVTTTEEFDDYYNENLLRLGDWVFPNSHPFFHGQLDPLQAVTWTKGAYEDLERRTDRFILFKEVGLPTAGDPDRKLSEGAQNQYYQELEKTAVRFVYFEAFDQPWKTNLPIEPYWGVFFADRTPKELANRLMGEKTSILTQVTPINSNPAETTVPVSDDIFYVYSDGASPDNHFNPSGYMGDTGDIRIDSASSENPQSGNSSVQVEYSAQGNGPNACDYAPPCRWAGVYWQQPANNWGKDQVWEGTGYDLSGFSHLKFWARADSSCTVEFKVGGIIGPYGDSLTFPRGIAATLSSEWKEYEIDLTNTDLSYVIGGFVWSTSWEKCLGGATFYLDEIRFEK